MEQVTHQSTPIIARGFLKQFTAGIISIAEPKAIATDPTTYPPFHALIRTGEDLFTLGDLETIAGVTIFGSEEERSKCLKDEQFFKALCYLQSEGVISKALRELNDFGWSRGFGCIRK